MRHALAQALALDPDHGSPVDLSRETVDARGAAVLAMRGVPAMVIKELAGRADLATTMRYMHLAKGSKEAGIAALEAKP